MSICKRLLACAVICALCALPLCGCSGNAAVWNGPVAKGFAAGSGTEADPYIIRTAEELAYFAKAVNGGDTFSGKYVRLDADITLNDEDFTFDPDSGLVTVTDGTTTGYLGTGLKGDGSGKHETFDSTATLPGVWYDSELGTAQSTYKAELRMWVPIGTNGNDFCGHFDGAGHTVRGLYISSHRIDQGLFGVVKGGTVKNVLVDNSYVGGVENIGAVVGFANGTVTGCANLGVVCASGAPAKDGIVAGGIVGYAYEGTVGGCVNMGVVLSATSVAGGIVGEAHKSTVKDSKNEGVVCVTTGMAGGIIGSSTGGQLTSCIGKGTVSGYTYVGALIGQAENETVSDCTYFEGVADSAFGHKADGDGVSKVSAE